MIEIQLNLKANRSVQLVWQWTLLSTKTMRAIRDTAHCRERILPAVGVGVEESSFTCTLVNHELHTYIIPAHTTHMTATF